MDIAAILGSGELNGLKGCVEVAIDTDDFQERLALAHLHPGLRFSAGVHPNSCARPFLQSRLELVNKQCQQPLVVAIGETGLDYYRNLVPELQKEAFDYHLLLGAELDLPVIVHNREADKDVLQMIESSNCRKGVFHCFSSGKDEMCKALDLGFHISFGGSITFKKNQELRDLIAFVPKNFMLIETDSPYLSPEPMRGKLNSPENLPFILKVICSMCSVDKEEMAHILYENAKKLFTGTRK